jgi:hypothetical protein
MKQSLKTVIVSFIVAGFLDGVAAIIILGNYNFSSVRKCKATCSSLQN